MKILNKFFGRRINEKGQEVPDPTPVELPVGYKAPQPLDVRMRQMIRNEMSQYAEKAGYETWEEANDFNVSDESDDGMFVDEDENVAVNDPFVERAFHEKTQELNQKYEKQAKSRKLNEAVEEKENPANAK